MMTRHYYALAIVCVAVAYPSLSNANFNGANEDARFICSSAIPNTKLQFDGRYSERGVELAQSNCYYRTYTVQCGETCNIRYVVSGGVRIPVRDCKTRYCPQSQRICR